MPTGNWNLEWENLNGQRAYPLTDDATGVDVTGSFTLPNSFILGLDFPVSETNNVDPSQFFLYQLNTSTTGFLITIGYQPSSGSAIPVATSTLSALLHTPGTVYALTGIGNFADSNGTITIGRLAEINAQPAGLFNFSVATARLEPDAVRPMIRGISSITVVSGTDVSEPMYGDIELVADTNIQIVPVIVSGQNPQILISAINGEGLADACVCTGSTSAIPINFINGIPPTSDGNFSILGSGCLQVAAITNGIQLNDTCSQPCCGCTELEEITTKLNELGLQASTLSGFVSRLSAEVTTMSLVVLGSKLNDNGCVTG